MVYFAIIIFYCTLFTIGAYMFIKHLRDIELQHLRDKHNQQIEELRRELINTVNNLNIQHRASSSYEINNKYKELETYLNNTVNKLQEDLFKQNESYLSQIRNNVSSIMEEIKQDIKNKPVI